MSGTTTRLALPYPGPTDGPDGADVPYWMEALATALDGAAIDDQGVFASRPVSTGGSPGIKGRYYFVTGDSDATKNGILWRDNGTGWDQINPAAGTAPIVTDGDALGYGTGSGGAVTQLTNRTTAVTLNKPSGQITTKNSAATAGTLYSFMVNNSEVGATDVPDVVAAVVNDPADQYWVSQVNAGSFRITYLPKFSHSNAYVFNFAIVKAAVS